MTAASNLAHPAERVPVLAELFTSEGCNSCPPADALLRKLDREQPVSSAQIIVLSEHVDYWNYLGWRDPFSSPLFSRRQSDYTRMLGAENFTPQLVIDGREQVLGSDPAAAQAAIARAAARVKSTIRVEAKREGGQAVIAIVIEPRTRSDVWLAIADESARSSVTAGENARRTLDHVAVARSLSKIGAVKKSQPFEKTLRVPVNAGPSRVVIFLADPANPVQGAALALIP
jgi:hypothetical protein